MSMLTTIKNLYAGAGTFLASTIFLYLLLFLLPAATFAATEERCEAYVQNSLLQNREKVVNNCSYPTFRSLI